MHILVGYLLEILIDEQGVNSFLKILVQSWYVLPLIILDIIVYYSIGFTQLALEFGVLPIRRKILMLVNNVQYFLVFFSLMFLSDGIKFSVENKLKTSFIFYATVQGREEGRVRNKTSFVSFRVRFGGDKKNFIKKTRKTNSHFDFKKKERTKFVHMHVI